MNIQKINNKIGKLNNKIFKRIDFSPNDGLKMDGVDDHVSFGDIFNFVGADFSISMIVRFNSFTTTPNNTPILISKGIFNVSGYYLFCNNNTIIFRTNQSGVNQSSSAQFLTLNTTDVYHITVTRVGASVLIYLNGVNKTTTFATHLNPLTTSLNLYIGTHNLGNYSNITCYDLKIFNKRLTQSEITELYNSANKKIPTTTVSNLISNYKFDQRLGTNLIDYSGNGYSGTLTNFGTTSNLGGGAWVDVNGNTITQL